MRIIFWDHYDATMGGVEKLIITLTKDLAESHEIVVIARKHSTISDTLAGLNMESTLIDPDTADLSKFISRDDLLVDFGTYRDFQALSAVNPRLLVWRVFPYIGCKSFFAFLLSRLQFTVLDKKDSLFFMDNGCYEKTCRELKSTFKRCILPIPIIVREKKYVVERSRTVINITYIGRGSRIWKVKPVKKLVSDLRSIANQRFHVHIFTDTDELFEKELKNLKGGNVAIDYHFGYTMESLSQKLLELSDLHFSMGTACLEGAVLGIPTMIADASYSDYPDNYRYRWLIEDIEYYAGVLLENATPRGHRLEEIIDSLHNPKELQRISDMTYNETVANFASEKIAQVIERLQPQARVRDVLRFMPSYWLSGGSFCGIRKRLSHYYR